MLIMYMLKFTVADANTFTAQVADSGDTSGSAGAYIPAFDVSSFTDTALTIESPSAGNCQLMSLTHFIDTMENTSVTSNSSFKCFNKWCRW